MEFEHIPVMLEECMDGLNIRPDGIYVDGTAGGAGHSSQIAKRLTTGRLLALDKDPDALEIASARLAQYPAAGVYRSDFADMTNVLDAQGVDKVDGILLDLGVSSHQLDTPERGFSYSADAPLDMRMSQSGLSAGDVLNTWPPEELIRILREYGEEKFASRIVHNIVAAREKAPLTSTAQLVDIIYASIPAKARAEGGHPAKRTFQAIRIAVNGELDSLTRCLDTAFDRLAPGGRFVIISFHSLEDRIVKLSFAGYCKGCTCPPDFPVCVCGNKPRAKLISRKPIVASKEELERNRRSKSAKLRIIEKL